MGLYFNASQKSALRVVSGRKPKPLQISAWYKFIRNFCYSKPIASTKVPYGQALSFFLFFDYQ